MMPIRNRPCQNWQYFEHSLVWNRRRRFEIRCENFWWNHPPNLTHPSKLDLKNSLLPQCCLNAASMLLQSCLNAASMLPQCCLNAATIFIHVVKSLLSNKRTNSVRPRDSRPSFSDELNRNYSVGFNSIAARKIIEANCDNSYLR